MASLLDRFRKIRKDIDSFRNVYKSTDELKAINTLEDEDIRRTLLLLSDSHRTEIKQNNNNIYKVLTDIIITCSEAVHENERKLEKIAAFEKIVKIVFFAAGILVLFSYLFLLYKSDPVAFREVTDAIIKFLKIFKFS